MLSKYNDDRGILHVLEFEDMPFAPQRLFYVANVPKGTVRGGHSHETCKQMLICLQGEVLLKFDDQIDEVLLKQGDHYLLETNVWGEQQYLTGNDVLLVMCSTPYDEKGYIRERPSLR